MATIHDVVITGPPQVGKKSIEKHLLSFCPFQQDSGLILLSNGHSMRIKTVNWKDTLVMEERIIKGMEALVVILTMEDKCVEQVKKFLKAFRKKAASFPLLLIANKKDLYAFPTNFKDSFSSLSTFEWMEGSAHYPKGREFLRSFESVLELQNKENTIEPPSTPMRKLTMVKNGSLESKKALKPSNGLERRSSVFIPKKIEESLARYSTFSSKEKKRKSLGPSFFIQKTQKTETVKSASPTKQNKSNLFVTLQDLISMIFEETTEDDDFVSIFIHTFPTFTTLADLTEELKETWKLKKEEDSTSNKPFLIKFLTKLIDTIPVQTFSEDPTFVSRLEELVSLMDLDFASPLSRQIERKKNRSQSKREDWFAAVDPRRRSSSVPQPRVLISLLDLEPKKVAEQLILIDHSLLKGIQIREFLDLSWTKKEGGKTIKAMIDRSNQFSNWAVTQIVSVMDLKKRISTLRWFIRLGEHSANLNNYNGLMCILGALGSSSVSRLKKTWAEVGKSYTKCFELLLDLMSCSLNYKNYRERLSKSDAAIPFLGVVLSDLIFLDEGNASFSESGEINWTKREFLGKWISQFEGFQNQQHLIERDRNLHVFLNVLDSFEEDVAYQLSLTAEPRTTARSTIEVQ